MSISVIRNAVQSSANGDEDQMRPLPLAVDKPHYLSLQLGPDGKYKKKTVSTKLHVKSAEYLSSPEDSWFRQFKRNLVLCGVNKYVDLLCRYLYQNMKIST